MKLGLCLRLRRWYAEYPVEVLVLCWAGGLLGFCVLLILVVATAG